MDATFTVFQKTAFILFTVLLLAAPWQAQAQPTLVLATSAVTLCSDQATQVAVTSDGAAITFTSSTLYDTPGANWLSVTGQGTTPTTLFLRLGGSLGLHNGSTATVTLTPTSPANAIATTLTVTFTSLGQCAGIAATPNPLVVNVANGGTNSGTVTLTSPSPTGISFTVTTQSSFLSVTPSSGSVSTSNSAILAVTVNAANLPPNTVSNGSITVQPSTGQTLTIQVQVTAGAGGGTGGLTANPSTVSWSFTTGGTLPSFVQVALTSSTGASSYSAVASSNSSNWLLVSSGLNSSGFITGTAGDLLVTPSSAIGSLTTGTYSGTITVTASDSSTATIVVTLTVNGGSSTGLSLSASSVTLPTAVAGGAQQSSTLNVTSTSSGTMSASVSGSGLSVAPATASITANVPVTVTVSGNPQGLSANTYNGSLTITVGASTQTIPVVFTVTTSGTATTIAAPAALSFAYQVGTPVTLVKPQALTVFGGASFTAITQVSTTQTWLSATPASGTTPTSLITVSADPTGLGVGTYTGSVSVTTSAGTQVVAVSLIVTASPVLIVDSGSPGALNFSFQSGNADPVVQLVVLVSDGSNLPVSITTSTPWLAINSSQVTPATVVVHVVTAGLANGPYNGSIVITSSGAANSPLTMPVELVVSGSSVVGGVTLGASTLTFNATVNGSAPPSQNLGVSAGTATAFAATAQSAAGWLSISPNGSLTTNQNIVVSANPAGLTANTYNGTITVTAGGVTQTVNVSLIVANQGGTGNVTASATSLNFTFQQGGTAPGAQTLTISNATQGTAPISFTAATSTTDGATWLLVTPQVAATQTNLSVSVSAASLAPGTYTGQIAITPSGGSVLTVPVNLTVQAAATVSAAPGNLTFTFTAGGANPGTQPLSVSSNGAALTFSAQATSAGNWLAVSPATGTTPATLTVSVDPGNLIAGTYVGSIAVSGTSGATGSSTIGVTLKVQAPLPTITKMVNAASFLTGSIAPGEIITIGGTSIGPATAVGPSLDQSGKVATTIGNTQVLVNGFLAPMILASSTLVSAIVPYEIRGQVSANVQVRFFGQTSNALSVPVTATAPGIFAANAAGGGPGAILNQDGRTVNSPSAPAAKGDIVAVYLTGEGETNPPGITGKLNNVTSTQQLPVPLLPIAVLVDGQPANYKFAGGAPGFVSGLMQLNVEIPAAARSGNLSLTVSIGVNRSQDGITVSVK